MSENLKVKIKTTQFFQKSIKFIYAAHPLSLLLHVF